MGLRRIWTRGINSANKFMLGAAIAYNLKKWMNYQEQKRKTALMALKNAERSLYSLILTLWTCTMPVNTNLKKYSASH
jgi:hypothetical protein